MPYSSIRRALPLCLIAILYILVRVGGITSSFYQDELDWVIGIVRGEISIPHPPLSALVYKIGAFIFGEHLLRLTPFVLGLAVLFFLWLTVKKRAGNKAAYWAVGLFSVAYYSVLASLMIDVDGQWLPLLFLVTLYSFDRWLEAQLPQVRADWVLLGTLAVVIGLSTKLSFVIAFGSLVIEYLFIMRSEWKQPRFWAALTGYCAGVAAIVLLIIFLGRFLMPVYSVHTFTSYTIRFFSLHRGWLQIIIQTVKAFMYLSPALVLLPFLIPKSRWAAVRPFGIFAALNLTFYLVLFDFSAAALDRYLMALIIPLCALAGSAIAEVFSVWKPNRSVITLWGILSVLLIIVQFVPHDIVAQYPKTAWFSQVIEGHWAFLMPFSGGSGPLGFYVSWLTIGIAWSISVVVLVLAFIRKSFLPVAVSVILVLSATYSVIFTEEYQFGLVNGSAQKLLRNASEIIASDQSIRRVITYNDIGAYELKRIKKYERRLYIAPKFEASYVDILNSYDGHWLIIDIPHISPDSMYGKYFALCKKTWGAVDGAITASILKCNNSQ